MSEVKVEKSKSLARRETPGLSPFNDFFTPAFSARFVGLSPFAMMREFTEEMDRLYRANGPALEAWSPTVDIQQSNGDLVVTAELPGLRKEEVKVEVTNDALIIEGSASMNTKWTRRDITATSGATASSTAPFPFLKERNRIRLRRS